MGQIKITGKAKRIVEADICKYTIGVTKSEATLNNAINSLLKDIELLISELNKLKIKTGDIHLENDNISEYYQNEKKYYKAYREVSFNTSAKASLNNKLYKILADNKLKANISTKYSYSKEDETNKELIKEALLDSKAKAELLASANNQIVEGIKEVDDRDNVVPSYTKLHGINLEALDNGMLSDDLSAKTITLEQEIYVTWKIK